MIFQANQDENVCANLHFKMTLCFYIIQGHEVSREKNPENTERGPDGDHHPESPQSLLVRLHRKHLSAQECSFSQPFLPRLTGSRSSCGSSARKTTWSSLEGISSRTRWLLNVTSAQVRHKRRRLKWPPTCCPFIHPSSLAQGISTCTLIFTELLAASSKTLQVNPLFCHILVFWKLVSTHFCFLFLLQVTPSPLVRWQKPALWLFATAQPGRPRSSPALGGSTIIRWVFLPHS